MKTIAVCFLLFFFFNFVYSQNDYPEPEKTENRLFYIQHSNNHNTYVYDFNLKEDTLDINRPINEYRIVYTNNGEIKPLTKIQRNLAYGIIKLDSEPNLLKLRLSASKNLILYLQYNEDNDARVFVNVNEQKIYLDRMFIKLNENILNSKNKVKYALFYGKDYYTGESVVEKVYPKKQ